MGLELLGRSVTPHVNVASLRYLRPVAPSPGALVRLFVRSDKPLRRKDLWIDEATGAEHLGDGEWSWFDFPDDAPDADRAVPAGHLTVLTFNAIQKLGAGLTLQTEEDGPRTETPLAPQTTFLHTVTFLGDGVQPDRLRLYLHNGTGKPLRIERVRLWLPTDPRWPHAFQRRHELRVRSKPIPAGELGTVLVKTEPLPQTYTVLEVEAGGVTCWAHLRIKRESFDLSGGWIGEKYLGEESYLKALKALHLNTGHIPLVAGYDDTPLAERYPIKHFHFCQPIERYDTDALLPRIHGIEFLGEPQYGGRKGPTAPQAVWKALAPFQSSRLPTTVTWSDARTWARYAGISDYPHYDAYRVCAPAADFWGGYTRWGEGKRIRWGAPLETIGEMCRALRENYRPTPTAYWSQGPHDGWEGYRPRSSPTPDELRAQAYFALASRITSLYWFNITPRSLVKFRDTYTALQVVGREIRLLENLYLDGAASHWEATADHWELSVIAGEQGSLLFALDTDYAPDLSQQVFTWKAPRAATFRFPLPALTGKIADCFRVDASGLTSVRWKTTKTGIAIDDTRALLGLYLATPDKGLRARLEARRQALVVEERRYGFDPGQNDTDFATLQAIARR